VPPFGVFGLWGGRGSGGMMNCGSGLEVAGTVAEEGLFIEVFYAAG
jgi:hypothetical protein